MTNIEFMRAIRPAMEAIGVDPKDVAVPILIELSKGTHPDGAGIPIEVVFDVYMRDERGNRYPGSDNTAAKETRRLRLTGISLAPLPSQIAAS